MLLILVFKQLYEVVELVLKKKTGGEEGRHELVTSCHPKITDTFIGVLQMQMVSVG